MSPHTRRSTPLVALALLVAFAAPVAATEAPEPATPTGTPAVEPAVAPEALPAGAPDEPALESPLEQSFGSQYGDCVLFCDGQQVRYSFVTQGQCCGGTLTCPDGSHPGGAAFYPYQGFAVFCST